MDVRDEELFNMLTTMASGNKNYDNNNNNIISCRYYISYNDQSQNNLLHTFPNVT